MTSIPLTLKSRLNLLCIAVTGGKKEMASGLMDTLKEDGMLGAAGFTTQDTSGNGLLQIAALHGHSEISEELLKRGININAVDRNHGTALQAAIYMGQEKIYRHLLDWGKQKINVNTKGGYYGCALQVAAYKGNDELVQELVTKHQADVNISGGKYGSPLQAAVRTGLMDVVKPILSKSDVNFKGGKYGSALQAVARGVYRTRTRLPEISRGQVLKQSAQISSGEYVDRTKKQADDTAYIEVAEALFKNRAQMDGGSGILDNPINAAACSGSKGMLELM